MVWRISRTASLPATRAEAVMTAADRVGAAFEGVHNTVEDRQRGTTRA